MQRGLRTGSVESGPQAEASGKARRSHHRIQSEPDTDPLDHRPFDDGPFAARTDPSSRITATTRRPSPSGIAARARASLAPRRRNKGVLFAWLASRSEVGPLPEVCTSRIG